MVSLGNTLNQYLSGEKSLDINKYDFCLNKRNELTLKRKWFIFNKLKRRFVRGYKFDNILLGLENGIKANKNDLNKLKNLITSKCPQRLTDKMGAVFNKIVVPEPSEAKAWVAAKKPEPRPTEPPPEEPPSAPPEEEIPTPTTQEPPVERIPTPPPMPKAPPTGEIPTPPPMQEAPPAGEIPTPPPMPEAPPTGEIPEPPPMPEAPHAGEIPTPPPMPGAAKKAWMPKAQEGRGDMLRGIRARGEKEPAVEPAMGEQPVEEEVEEVVEERQPSPPMSPDLQEEIKRGQKLRSPTERRPSPKQQEYQNQITKLIAESPLSEALKEARSIEEIINTVAAQNGDTIVLDTPVTEWALQETNPPGYKIFLDNLLSGDIRRRAELAGVDIKQLLISKAKELGLQATSGDESSKQTALRNLSCLLTFIDRYTKREEW